MDKNKLIQDLVLKHTGVKVSIKDSKAVYEDLLLHFSEEINSVEGLSLRGIGKLQVKNSPERKVRNPKTGDEMIKPLNKRVSFKASSLIKKTINL